MEGAKLTVEVEAKITALRQALERDAPATLIKFDKLVSGISNNTMPRFAKGSNEAAMALTNLGRVAQDAPYGFIGIQNNLNPLLESFQRLKAETGSTGGALKALASSLTGPAGFGIALSVVSAALLVYNAYLAKTAKETKEVADANEDLAESASKEIAKVTILYDASQNLNIPLKERKKIVDELQKQYPTTFGNLKDEAILAGKAQVAYENLTQSLINAAVVRGGEDLIAEKVKGLASTLLAFQQQVQKFDPKGKGTLPKSSAFFVDETGDVERLTDYEERIKKEIKNVRDAIQATIGNFSAESIIGNFGDGDKKTKEHVKNISDVYKALSVDLLQAQNDITGTFTDQQTKQVQAYQKAINDLIQLGVNPASGQIGQLKDKAAELSTEIGNAGFATKLEKSMRFMYTVLPQITEQIVKIPKESAKILTPFQSILSEILPKLQSGFDSFFTNILEHGQFSIKSLGQAILKTFESVLASQATAALLNLIASAANIGGSNAGGGGAAKNVAGAVGSALPLLAGGSALSGGALLPILAGAAAVGGIISLFGHKNRNSSPASSNPIPSYSGSSGGGTSSVMVQAVIRGRDLVMLLNLEGYYLSRVQQNGRG